MAAENYTTYTEVDENADYTVTSTKIDIVTMARDSVSYVYKDAGVAHFDGDFDHDFEYFVNSSTQSGELTGVWAVSNSVNNHQAHQDANQDILIFLMGEEATGVKKRLREQDGSTTYDSTDNADETTNTLYYATAERDEAVGTYGTIYIYTYTDSGRTSLADTRSIALHTSKKDYRYIYGAISDGGATSNTTTGFVQNLDLQEAVGPANVKSWNGVALSDIKSINGLAIASIKSINGVV